MNLNLEILRAKFAEINDELVDNDQHINSKVLLIDGMNTYIRAFSVTPSMNDNGDHVGGITGFFKSIGAAIRLVRPTRVVIVFDGKGGSQRRREMFGDYKAKRKTMTKLNRTYDFKTLEQESNAMRWQLQTVAAMLKFLPITVMAPELVEADDVLAYLAQAVEQRNGKAFILSTDKDFLQLVNENITVYNPVKKKMYRPAAVVEDYGFHPNNFLLYRVVTGDKSDCVPGIEDIKEKTLLKYFPELKEAEKRNIQFLLDQAGQIVDAKKKKPPVALVRLLSSRATLERNMKLMRLDEVAMSGNTKIDVLNKFDAPLNNFNKKDFQQYLITLKSMSSFENFDSWIVKTFSPLMRFNK